jgi:hypothetical protein
MDHTFHFLKKEKIGQNCQNIKYYNIRKIGKISEIKIPKLKIGYLGILKSKDLEN